MYAFCPLYNQQACGSSYAGDSSGTTTGRLNATKKTQVIYSTKMRYRGGDGNRREYDFCYYMIKKDANMTQEMLDEIKEKAGGVEPRLFIRLKKKERINVYIYGGSSRENATEQLVADNAQAELGLEYSVPLDSGILVIAFPNEEDDKMLLALDYWVDAREPVKPPSWSLFSEGSGQVLFTLVFLLLVAELVVLVGICCKKSASIWKMKAKIRSEAERVFYYVELELEWKDPKTGEIVKTKVNK